MVLVTPVDKTGRPLLNERNEYVGTEGMRPEKIYPGAHIVMMNKDGQIAVQERSPGDSILGGKKLPFGPGGMGHTSDLYYEYSPDKEEHFRPDPSKFYARIALREAKEETGLSLLEKDLIKLDDGLVKLGELQLYVVLFGCYYDAEKHGKISPSRRGEKINIKFERLTKREIREMASPLAPYDRSLVRSIGRFNSKGYGYFLTHEFQQSRLREFWERMGIFGTASPPRNKEC